MALSAALALMAGMSAQAQTLGTIGGPTEQPPGSYAGQMYVDSRGCVFLRAGFGGQVTWVPRVTAARKPLCGYPPSLGPKLRVEVAEAAPAPPAPPPVRTAATASAAAVTSPAVRMVKPVAATMPPRSSYVPAMPHAAVRAAASKPKQARSHSASSRIGARRIGCYASAPVPVRVALVSGGTVVVCTAGDGTMNGARPPIYPPGSAPGAAFGDQTRLAAEAPHAPRRIATPEARRTQMAAVPKGYKLAWEDGRLNPLRGKGTVEGQTAQDRVWIRTVPAKAVKPARHVRVASQPSLSAKTLSSQPLAALYVQVGSYAQPANAEGAAGRLAALGLPVARSRADAGRLQVVLAGPFGDAGAANSALANARRAGFGDAFVRR